MNQEEFQKYYERELGQFERLRTAVVGILQSAIADKGIETLALQSRVKTLASAADKCQVKAYTDPTEQLTDIVGFRVICYIESDVDVVQDLLRNLFEIDEENSLDKRNQASPRELGYRSLHLICTLGKARKSLAEYSGLTAIKFEIQVRSVLQHAWAEIEHKRNYKGKFSLPQDLERRLMIASGALELIDREFSEIARVSAKYVESIRADNESFSDDPISGLALLGLYSEFLAANGFGDISAEFKKDSNPTTIAEELNAFGVSTVSKARNFLNSDLARSLLKSYKDKESLDYLKYVVGFCRHLMIATDIEKYFDKAFNGGFTTFASRSSDVLEPFVSKEKLTTLAKRHGIEVR